jgi:hypothetical protein
MTRTCLFAHHDRTGRIAPHVLHYLQQLHACGFTTHVAMSGAERVHEADRAALAQAGAIAHLRPNRGLDFGAWQDLVALGCANGSATILLANDSVFGPLAPLQPVFADMDARQPDIWGMVESREGSWHLQSWFLCFTAAAFASPAIARVLRQPFADMSKAEIVLHGELGLGAAIRADRLRWTARARTPNRQLRRLVPGNPMHLDFLSMIRGNTVPFIKIELLRDNPAAVRWVGHWRKAVASSPIFPVGWIDRHLSGDRPHIAPCPNQSLKMRLLYAAITRDRRDALQTLLRR